MISNKNGFTLIELVVVITILAILGTISFLSMQNYFVESRNSIRITQVAMIEEGLGFHKIESNLYPKPSNYTSITYNGGTLWYQGIFGESVNRAVNLIDKLPLDPLFEIEYDYSTLTNQNKYQIGTVIESNLFTNSTYIGQANALEFNDLKSYISGEFEGKEAVSKNAGNCYVIPTPSLFINTTNGNIVLGGNYNFMYEGSPNINSRYYSRIKNIGVGTTVKIDEIYNKCIIENLDQLNLYISKLSLRYQQLLGDPQFNEIIYHFNKTGFKLGTINHLRQAGISVSEGVVNSIKDGITGYIFTDTFTSLDNTNLVGDHIPDSYGSWIKDISLDNNSYQMDSFQLKKVDNLNGLIYPSPTIAIKSVDRGIILNIVDFAGGSIFIYSNYIDNDNYVLLEINSSGYTRSKMEGGILSIYDTDNSSSFPQNSTIEFNVFGGNIISLSINSIDKGDIINGINLGNGKVGIKLPQNAIIDNFTLIYK